MKTSSVVSMESSNTVWRFVGKFLLNISFVLFAFAIFLAVMSTTEGLSLEAKYTIASLLCIALSDLYLGRGNK